MAQDTWKQRAERAEARVEELEKELAALKPKDSVPTDELVVLGPGRYTYRPVEKP